MTKEQEALLREELNRLLTGEQSLTAQREGSEFPGELSADMGSSEQGILDQFLPTSGNIQQGNTAATNALVGMLTEDPTAFEDFYRTNVKDPALREFEEDIGPALSRRYAKSGFYSGERIKSEDRAGRELLDDLMQSRSKLAFQTQESGKERALRAAGIIPQVGASTAQSLLGLLQGAGVERDYEQGKIDREYEDFLRRTDKNRDQELQELALLLGARPFENITEQKGGSTGLLGGFLGGAGKGIGTTLGSMIPFCDRRVKKDIRQVRVDRASGLPIYQFYYKADPTETLYEGPMADEVQARYPDAIVVGSDGMLRLKGGMGIPMPREVL